MICRKCEIEKPESEFYRGCKKCKECTCKDVRANRVARADYYREYERGRANLPHRVEARNIYSKTESGHLSHNRAKIAWTQRNPVKRTAVNSVNNAVRSGKLIKPQNCQSCGKSNCRIHGHHDDYSMELNVRWLCDQCHRNWHKEHGEGLNA
jgi:hypothetical protein